MGLGMGYIAEGLNRGREDNSRKYRDFKRDQREETLFQQQQEDRKNFGMKKMQREDELGDLSLELKRNEAEIMRKIQGARSEAAQMKALQEVAELEDKNYGLVYSAYKTRGGKVAARLLNEMRANNVQNATDFVEFQDPKTGRKMLKVVDEQGNVVQADDGPAVLDIEELDRRYAPKDKGRFSESERGITDTATGKFSPHSKGVGRKADKELADLQRKLTNDAVAILQANFGGRLEGETWFPDEENRETALNALEMAADLVAEGHPPQRAANMAADASRRGALPKSRRQVATPKSPDEYFKILRGLPENKGSSDEELRQHVASKFPNWKPAK